MRHLKINQAIPTFNVTSLAKAPDTGHGIPELSINNLVMYGTAIAGMSAVVLGFRRLSKSRTQ